MQKQLIQTLKILLAAIVLSLGISYVYAWTGPVSAPPTGNTNPPLVSTTDTTAIQTTEGKLVANTGLATMGNVIVANDVNALNYCDETGTICVAGSALGGAAGKWNDVNGGIHYSGGNVGIGTGAVAPGAKLDVVGGINLSGNISLPATTATAGSVKINGQTILHSYGANNIFLGVDSGNFTTTGSYNVSNGYNTLNSNTTGSYNTAIGYNTLKSNTVGSYNTANGYAALYSNATGLFNTVGSNNTANGYTTLYSNTSGSNNTAIGNQALYANTSGSNNTAGGYKALYSNTYSSSNTAYGRYALLNNTSGGNNTAIGDQAILRNTVGSANTAIGLLALYVNTTGWYNTAVGFDSGVTVGNLTNTTAIGMRAKVNASNKVRIGNTSVTRIEGQVGWSSASDLRLKKNIKNYKYGLDFITQLRPVEFTFIADKTDTPHVGFIAQEVEATGVPFPGLVKPETKDAYYSLTYSEMVAPLTNAIKELKTENDSLRIRVEKLEEIVRSLDQRIKSEK